MPGPARSTLRTTTLLRRALAALLGATLLALAVPGAAPAAPCGFVGKTVLQPIPDPPPVFGAVTSRIYVPESATLQIEDLDVRLNLRHTQLDQVDVSLEHDGVRIALTTDNGGTGNDYAGTRFDDEAATAVTNGTAPFSGSYRPEQPLSAFDGRSLHGVWTLTVSDDFPGETGTLDGWALDIDSTSCAGAMSSPRFPPCYEVGRDPALAVPEGAQLQHALETTAPLEQLEDVDVRVSVDHPAAGEVALNLEGSSGEVRRIRLSDGNGGTGDDYFRTLFDDGADVAITAGAAPFQGSFRPEQPLSTFVGGYPPTSRDTTTWTLDVADAVTNDQDGVLTSWGVIFRARDGGCEDPDGDQIPSVLDSCDLDADLAQDDRDDDGQGDACDADDDGDGRPDTLDACPLGQSLGDDHDRDGCKDLGEDADDDGDGVPDASDACPRGAVGPGADLDGDGCRDEEDVDDDGDGLTDVADACPQGATGTGDDADGDGCKTAEDPDPVTPAPGTPTSAPGAATSTGASPAGTPGDPDGDGVLGTADRCPDRRGARPHGCPVAARRLTLRHSARTRRFTVRLTSADPACRSRQGVVLRRVRRGPDPRVGRSVRTTTTGRATVRRTVRPGRYYVQVAARTLPGRVHCAAARARAVRVR